MSVVSNSTPLISLATLNALDLLETLYGTIIIPPMVYQEVVVAGQGKAGAQAVANATWIQTQPIKNTRAVNHLRNVVKLDPGESEAIVLAQECSATLILLDDLAARHYAQQKQMPIMGTVGVLLVAKQYGLIQLVRPYLNALIAAGIFIDATLYRLVLQRAGE